MIYDYKCSCGNNFFVVKSIKEYAGEPEPCPSCNKSANRMFTPPQAIVRGFEPNFYHSFGKVFNTKKELDYHVDSNNMVHVGNDFGSGDTMQKSFEKDRQDRWQKDWENL